MRQIKGRKSPGVTLRALAIGLLLILINCFWIMPLERVWGKILPTQLSIFFNVVFSLQVMALLNIPLRKFLPQFALSQGELLVVYVMLCMATAISGFAVTQGLIPTMGQPFWFATPENEWKELFFQYIPRWLVVDDKDVLRGYYEGDSTFHTAAHIKGWLMPLIPWFFFILALIFIMLCINVIFRKQWTEREKLTYPIIQLPLMMSDASSLFSNRLLWMGFAIAGGIDIFNNLHFFYPIVPGIPIKYEIGRFFTEKPLNAIGWTPICFFTFIIGLGFFMPLDLSFSCWFFYLFRKAQLVLGSIMGWRSLPGFPYPREQSLGAYIGVCIITLWASRGYLKQVFLKAFGGKSELDESGEPMRYRKAIFGIVFGITFLIFFCYKAGMSAWLAFIFLVIYFALLISITRMRVELGPPMHELDSVNPVMLLNAAVGTRGMGGARNLTILSYLRFFSWDYRSNPMPHQLEGFKLAERVGISNKRLLFAILLATGVGIFVAFWAFLYTLYKVGESAGACPYWYTRATFDRLAGWLSYPTTTDYPALSFMGIGLSFTFLLMIARRRFLSWPLHPLGYPISGDWEMNWIWFSLFVSWLAKWVTLRYGGIKAYRRARFFFCGLILGQFTVGSIWSIIGLLLDRPVYCWFI